MRLHFDSNQTFQLDVIISVEFFQSARPIVIVDESQNMETDIEKLLRFIFSQSALREGLDNANVFQM